MSNRVIAYGLILSSIFFLNQEIPNNILIIGFFSLVLSFLNFRKKIINEFFKILVGLLSVYILWQKHHTLMNTEVGVSIVFIMSTLKLWEIENTDDLFNLFLILILLESCVLIVSPSVLTFIISILKMLFYFYYIIRIQNLSLKLINLRRLFILFLPAFCFAIFLYFIFPRFTEGFFGFNNQNGNTTFNNSNLNINKLTFPNLSSNKVFTAYGLDLKDINSTYWKSYVLWDFFKGEWRNSATRIKIIPDINQNALLKYRLIFENNYLDYITHLDSPSRVLESKNKISYFSDNTFKISPPLKGNHNFLIAKTEDVSTAISNIELKKTTRLDLLPEETNLIATKAFGSNWKKLEKENIIKRLNSFYLNNGFQYSKSPPLYKNTADFILNGKLGFCSHFASSYALLLRVYSIPSRVVIGYLGGEINPLNNSIVVRERDSHAWVEYYENKTWHRIDPTEFVAPDRVRLSTLDFFNKIEPYISILGFKLSSAFTNFAIINNLDYVISYLDNYLYNLLFSFDLNDQKALFKNKELYLFTTGLIAFFTIFYYLVRIDFKILTKNEDREYFQLIKKLRKQGLDKLPSETASEFRIRACDFFPEQATEISDIISKYINQNYK